MTSAPTILVVEPDEARREALRETLVGAAEIVEAPLDAQRALGARPERVRLVVALPSPARRLGEGRREVFRQQSLDLLATAGALPVAERALDGRDCDIELYAAMRSIGVEVWPESDLAEAAPWYRDGLAMTVAIKDRVAHDIARAHVSRELALTPAELTLLFRDLLDGGSYEQLGQELGVTAQTVKAHFRNMRQSSGLSRDELRSRALRALVFARGFVERE